MKPKYLLAACMTSCVLYFAVFGFLVRKPLTIGANLRYLDHKLEYLRQLEGRKLVLLAGSNGRFSHRCETLEQILALPCANMSIQAGISLDFQFSRIEPYLGAGDIVYLPLEYEFFGGDLRSMMGGAELPLCVAYEKEQLWNLGPVRLAYALFYFDLKFLIAGLGEMLLEAAGVQRRFSVNTLTKQGDESGHTRERAQEYRAALNAKEAKPWNDEAVDLGSYKANLLAEILRRAANKGVIVIGGLPTSFNDYPIPERWVERIGAFYAQYGHAFVALENKSQYPRSYFYDSPAHLSEPYQIAHTRALAGLLREELKGLVGR